MSVGKVVWYVEATEWMRWDRRRGDEVVCLQGGTKANNGAMCRTDASIGVLHMETKKRWNLCVVSRVTKRREVAECIVKRADGSFTHTQRTRGISRTTCHFYADNEWSSSACSSPGHIQEGCSSRTIRDAGVTMGCVALNADPSSHDFRLPSSASDSLSGCWISHVKAQSRCEQPTRACGRDVESRLAACANSEADFQVANLTRLSTSNPVSAYLRRARDGALGLLRVRVFVLRRSSIHRPWSACSRLFGRDQQATRTAGPVPAPSP